MSLLCFVYDKFFLILYYIKLCDWTTVKRKQPCTCMVVLDKVKYKTCNIVKRSVK